jgi:hypothetical protein
VCTVTGDEPMKVWVEDFFPNPWEPAATLEDLMAWLLAARQKLTKSYGMKAREEFWVRLHNTYPYLGYVAPQEKYHVLHLSDGPNERRVMQSTTAHEFFHLAQGETTQPNKTNLLPVEFPSDWLIEGTAKWFEDELFNFDLYKGSEPNPLGPILEVGLAARPIAGEPLTRSYSRFAFWKMVFSYCPGAALPDLFNTPNSSDKSGIQNFKALFESTGWKCSYAQVCGAEGRPTLADGLLFYTVATVKLNSIQWLDSNDNGFVFQNRPSIHVPSIRNSASSTVGWTATLDAPPASARSFMVDSPGGLSAHEAAFVQVAPSDANGGMLVWLSDYQTPGCTGQGYQDQQRLVGTYGRGGEAPAKLLVVVNPDPTNHAGFRLRAGTGQIGLTIDSAVCSFLGKTSSGQNMYRAVTQGTAVGVPGAYELSASDDIYPGGYHVLTCSGWTGSSEQGKCYAKIGDFTTTHWTRDSSFSFAGDTSFTLRMWLRSPHDYGPDEPVSRTISCSTP